MSKKNNIVFLNMNKLLVISIESSSKIALRFIIIPGFRYSWYAYVSSYMLCFMYAYLNLHQFIW